MNLIATDFLKYKLGSGRKCPISSTEVCGKRSLLQVWDGEIPTRYKIHGLGQGFAES